MTFGHYIMRQLIRLNSINKDTRGAAMTDKSDINPEI
jgi:hypothetical protein